MIQVSIMPLPGSSIMGSYSSDRGSLRPPWLKLVWQYGERPGQHLA